MLANDKRTGEWAVTEAIPNNPHIRYRVSTGLFSHVPNNAAAHCTPLLPSPATLQAHGLSVYDVAYQTFDQVDTSDDPHSTAGVICHRMEHMTLWWCGHDDKPHMLCKPITADNRNAAQRDLQRYTSLLAWLGGVE